MKRCLPLFALLVSPLALAHPGHPITGTLLDGFLHPFTGLDHMLAMLAVGLWSSRLHRNDSLRRLLVLPAAFIGFLLLGIALGVENAGLPAVEPMIAVSLLVLGLAAGIGQRIPQSAACAVVALFATFHGYAHGTELGGHSASIIGITLATAILHIAGIALGRNEAVRRLAAALVAAGGVFFLMQLA